MNTIAKACAIRWEISINHQSDTNSSTDASATPESRWTIKRLLDWTTEYFRENGGGQSRLDAEVLLAESIGCQRIELYTRFDEEPDESVKTRFRDWVARHAEGEPVAYLVGHKEFFSVKLEVSPDVLIPRPETEHLVTECLDIIASAPDTRLRLIDVGTGSGCVAISIAKHARELDITASDLSDAALQVAQRNAAELGVAERIRFVQSDLLEAFPEEESFEIIVSNPPYIGLDERESLDRSVRDYEPHQALFSDGPVGTEIISRLLEQAELRLTPNGWLLFEISPMIADRCRALIEQSSVLSFERFVADLAGHQRIVVCRKQG